jgi:alcohol dehydrogenase YqhD (iron-dependent ADH family)
MDVTNETTETTEKMVLGKNKKKKCVYVLIENNKTRKLHGERAQKIKKTSIQTVRNYLKNHNLIKSGSVAPNPLLRTLYENVLFCGDITNQNKENLIHNFKDNVEL